MEKSVFTNEYTAVTALLREMRRAAEVTQVELATRLKRGQSYVSKCERGELRVDVIQLRSICDALGTTLPAFVTALEKRLSLPKHRK